MKVYATKDNVKKFIRHVPTGYAFNEEGVSDWPDDQFTRRRLRDGDISLEPLKRGQTVTKHQVTDETRPDPSSIVGRQLRSEERQKEALAAAEAKHVEAKQR